MSYVPKEQRVLHVISGLNTNTGCSLSGFILQFKKKMCYFDSSTVKLYYELINTCHYDPRSPKICNEWTALCGRMTAQKTFKLVTDELSPFHATLPAENLENEEITEFKFEVV